MAEPKLSGTPQVDLDALINSAWGDKPVSVQKHFDNEMMQRAADLIAGKKDALHKDMFGQEPISNEQLAAEPTEQEIEDALNDEDTDDELESLVDSDEQEETQEEEPSDEEPSEEETDETS